MAFYSLPSMDTVAFFSLQKIARDRSARDSHCLSMPLPNTAPRTLTTRTTMKKTKCGYDFIFVRSFLRNAFLTLWVLCENDGRRPIAHGGGRFLSSVKTFFLSTTASNESPTTSPKTSAARGRGKKFRKTTNDSKRPWSFRNSTSSTITRAVRFFQEFGINYFLFFPKPKMPARGPQASRCRYPIPRREPQPPKRQQEKQNAGSSLYHIVPYLHDHQQ